MEKIQLLEKLEDAIEFEEDVILQLDDFVKSLINQISDLHETDKKKILKLYSTLVTESKKHSKTLSDLRKELESSKKNEF